jgi:hypothetical protein
VLIADADPNTGDGMDADGTPDADGGKDSFSTGSALPLLFVHAVALVLSTVCFPFRDLTPASCS